MQMLIPTSERRGNAPLKTLLAACALGVIVSAAAGHAAAGQGKDVKATTTGTKASASSNVRDHRGDARRLQEAPRKCYRDHTHFPDRSCVSTWAQTPGVKIREHRGAK